MRTTVSTQKWVCRLNGTVYGQYGNSNEHVRPKRAINLCKYQPKVMIKYINMQTVPCPVCKKQDLMTRCNDEHLLNKHNIRITATRMIIEKVVKLTKAEKSKKTNKDEKLSRKEMVGYAEQLIQPELDRLKYFLDHVA